MNRIQPSAKPIPKKSPASFSIQSGLFTPPSQDSTRAMFTPLHYESNYAYPLLVWLHAPGENDERQLLRIMPLVSLRNYVAVAPRGFACQQDDFPRAYCWPQTQDHIEEAEHRVFQSIEEASKRPHCGPPHLPGGLRRRRHDGLPHGHESSPPFRRCAVYLRGLPHRPQPPRPTQPGSQVAGVHGRRPRQPGLFAGRACEDLRLFHTAGITVALRQYPCGHQLTQQMLRDVDRWIIEQIST